MRELARAFFACCRSLGPTLMFVDVAKTRGLVLGDELCYRCEMEGSFANTDIWV